MNTPATGRFKLSIVLVLALFAMLCSSANARPVKYQVTGLFMKECEDDLRAAVEKIPGVKLVSIDFKNAEATFDYDPAKVFPGAKPTELLQRLDNAVKSASDHTFSIKPLRSTPLEKLRLIEIPVAGLDCKACSFAAYQAVARLEGVERATASFREGRVTALIDPEKTNRNKLVDALKKLGVEIKAP